MDIIRIDNSDYLEGVTIEIKGDFNSLDYNIYECVNSIFIYSNGLAEIEVSYTKDEEDIEATIITNINNILILKK